MRWREVEQCEDRYPGAEIHQLRDPGRVLKVGADMFPQIRILATFGATRGRRLFHGGLPAALLADTKSPSLYREWMDSRHYRRSPVPVISPAEFVAEVARAR